MEKKWFFKLVSYVALQLMNLCKLYSEGQLAIGMGVFVVEERRGMERGDLFEINIGAVSEG